ncbi:MAG: hypothetical protein QM661_01445 [Solimonas sp.]
MFVVLLRFSANRDRAARLMQAHKEWIQRGFDDGIFLLTGSIRPQTGGAIVAHGVTRPELEDRLNGDPFVAEDVVQLEIVEVTPSKADDRLSFLLD